MPQAIIDPWKAASNARKVGERKKTIRLAGNGPGRVHTLIKCHNWRSKAVYVYHLQKKALKRIDKPTDQEWETFTQFGVQIPYPFPDHPASDVEFWVRFGKEQAQELGLKVTE
jgi:hypothetical protein